MKCITTKFSISNLIFFLVISFFGITANAREVCTEIKIQTTGGCGSVNMCASGKEETQKVCYEVPDIPPGPIPDGPGPGVGGTEGGGSAGGASTEEKDKCASIANGKKYLCDRDALAYKKREYLKCGNLFFNDNLFAQCNLLVDTEAESRSLTCNFNHETAIAKCDKL